MSEADRTISRRTAGWTLFLLFLSNILNVADRTLLGVVTEQVRTDLALSDTQMSLANGLFFTLFNLVGGLFLSRLIDRGNRKRILAFGIAGSGPGPWGWCSPWSSSFPPMSLPAATRGSRRPGGARSPIFRKACCAPGIRRAWPASSSAMASRVC